MLKNAISVYKNKKVLITGHTGFKGSWLTLWLLSLGAKVSGYALKPPTEPALFDLLCLKDEIDHYDADIRDYNALSECLNAVRPDIIFHLAAQTLVRESYANPLDTLSTNVMGTANLLEATRKLGIKTNIIIVTSDKCYENQEWLFGYRESDKLGGYDPYSASKGATEIIASSFRRSFFNPELLHKHGVKIATVRAGNVIGGGDWAKDRIIPDCIKSLSKNASIQVRNPLATRPWQHVLEPLSGYLLLGSNLLTTTYKDASTFCSAFNFGPIITSNRTVEVLVDEIINAWGRGDWTYNKDDAHHEASLLNLTSDKAYHLLQWQPKWDFNTTVEKTVSWYLEILKDEKLAKSISLNQINEYSG